MKKPIIALITILIVIVSIITLFLHHKQYENNADNSNSIVKSDISPRTISKPIVESRSLPTLPMPRMHNIESDFSNVIFIGDSITFGFIKANNTPIEKDHVYAKIGAHVFEGSKLLGNNIDLITNRCNGSVDYVFLMFGANDYGYNIKSYKTWYKELINHVRKMFPNAKIILQSVMPMKSTTKEPNRSQEPQKLNKIIKSIAMEENINYMNISDGIPNVQNLLVADGLHFKSELYPLWITEIRKNEKQIS